MKIFNSKTIFHLQIEIFQAKTLVTLHFCVYGLREGRGGK